MVKRRRRTHSVTLELVTKSREAALAAVQIFNSPLVTFKAEIYIVLMNIAWTYLLHAYYRNQKLEYRYFEQKKKNRVFERTKQGAFKYWELERCINCSDSPLDKATASNLRFLIGIRHEIEHQMTTRIDSSLSAKFQACCLNYNEYIKTLYGDSHGIDKHLSFSLQFSSITREQAGLVPESAGLPSHIRKFVEGFEDEMPDDEFNSPKFAYRVLFIAKTANRKGQADEVIEFVKAGSELAQNVNQKYAVIKETERKKSLPSGIVALMQAEGYRDFKMHHHTELWKSMDAKGVGKGYGVPVEGAWYWYDAWIDVVRDHCRQNAKKFGKDE